MEPLDVLRQATFGRRTAEEEAEQLRRYFVETEQWSQVFNGEVDVVYGPKGSGKSAIYNLITQSADDLFDRHILLVPGENPQGTPAFKDIVDDPPYDEFQFVNVWKLYALTLCAHAIRDYGIQGKQVDSLFEKLEEAELIPAKWSLGRVLKYALDYVRSLTRPEAIETEMALDPMSGMPAGVKGKIVFREPSASQERRGVVSIDELYELTNETLEEAGYSLWIVLDRLDVAFAKKVGLEASALRALFKFYLDTKRFKNISTKIFLRTDIWGEITKEGFREASHIERALNINWSQEDLMNLVVKRMVANESICNHYQFDSKSILADFDSQEKFLSMIFPDQVETGPNKPKTFGWILGRTKDALSSTAPRELIHFLSELRDVQINRLERGEKQLAHGRLFEQISFKDALPEVSKTRLEQTIFAEYPALRRYIEALKEQKATQPLSNLKTLWSIEDAAAMDIASQLETIGFFERLSGSPATWRVPFLYRPALSLIQGSAEVANDE
ncbi:hypothetical protein CA233_13790 [Sphingomonas sp. ABOLD]|uniref:P-loop ATPase, Sll1717 family n=1 Tax=Sphingomonas sp. ABOLD TaxID=1985877 RepID=UPI000F7F10F4|nr:hypothetical protein [Sphingomonas sp. ABOLD]RSV45964.1 hypothetical protein CA233_13790 [Sphingomonas sp. ABOLD]